MYIWGHKGYRSLRSLIQQEAVISLLDQALTVTMLDIPGQLDQHHGHSCQGSLLHQIISEITGSHPTTYTTLQAPQAYHPSWVGHSGESPTTFGTKDYNRFWGVDSGPFTGSHGWGLSAIMPLFWVVCLLSRHSNVIYMLTNMIPYFPCSQHGSQINMIAADVLVPTRHQDICNHPVDLHLSSSSLLTSKLRAPTPTIC